MQQVQTNVTLIMSVCMSVIIYVIIHLCVSKYDDNSVYFISLARLVKHHHEQIKEHSKVKAIVHKAYCKSTIR